jgi:hypothetical protein
MPSSASSGWGAITRKSSGASIIRKGRAWFGDGDAEVIIGGDLEIDWFDGRDA